MKSTERLDFRARHFLAGAKRILGPDRYGDMRSTLVKARWWATDGLEARTLAVPLQSPKTLVNRTGFSGELRT